MEKALEGVKVLELSLLITIPLAGECLAACGATVIKVESSARADPGRNYVPNAEKKPGLNRCGFFAAFNANKYSISLNLNHPKSKEIAVKLVSWADIVLENFSPGVAEKWGLDYENLSQIKPEIIMIRASSQGQTGPHAHHSGIGTMLQGLSGFTHLTGWPDRVPIGVSTAYTDFMGPYYTVMAAIGALLYRQRTGKGQLLDLSQYECGLSFLIPSLLEYTANGKVPERKGNLCPYAAPHGVYRCRGEDRWCAIGVFSDEEWKALSRLIGQPWAEDPYFTTLLGRKEREKELDKLIEAWTMTFTPEEVMMKLQDAGVRAGLVEDGRDLHLDKQLSYRQHFHHLNHPEMGVCAYDALSFRFSKTPAQLSPAPCLGEHNELVYSKILGLSDEEFTQLLVEGVFE